MVKTLLIGYKSGIGASIYNNIPNIKGESLSTGFDINKQIIYDYSEFDTIIINAYSDFGSQLRLLYDIIETINKKTLVIVIASISAYRTNQKDISKSKYTNEKAAIIHAGRDLNELGYNVSIISPGITDTRWNKNKDCMKLKTDDISKIIMSAIDNYYNFNILTEHLVMRFKND